MNSLDGLEAMRLWPKDGNNVNVGIGDFATAGTDPNERLDIYDGHLRIRQLPTDFPDNLVTKIMVVDNSGLVKWRDASTLGDACSSGWSPVGAGNIATAWNGNPCIPQAINLLGIGTNAPTAKLDILKTLNSGFAEEVGLRSKLTATGITKIAVDAYVSTYSTMNIATRAYCFDADRNFGVDALASGEQNNYGMRGQGLNGTHNYGAQGFAFDGGNNVGVEGTASYGSVYNYGVHGQASGTMAYAGYFTGDVYTTGAYLPSDEMLKTNIQPLQGGLGVVLSLAPKTYDYQIEEYPQMALPQGPQAGVVAQDLEAVLPGLVKTAMEPAVYDSAGNVLSESVQFSAVNYIGLIPYLVGAIQEQQATIAQLQEQINQCCASQGSGMAPQGEDNTKSTTQNESDLQEQRLLVQPNPFTDHTTLQYYVPKSGKVSLQVSGGDGRSLGTLREEQADAGAYSYEWNTSQLSPGTYFCALLVDGNVVVKRAVKVAR